jgi:hypothetical protein
MLRSVFLAFVLFFSLGNASSDRIASLYENGDYAGALKEARTASERGDPLAHAWLGRFYENGDGVQADPKTAEFHYRIAAAQGENYARWRLGVMIDTGTAPGSLEEAVALFRKAASEDYANAIVSLAVMQATGRGTLQDYSAALNSYMRAARLGDSGGVRGVGVMLHLGEGVTQDSEEALAWFLVGAAMGNEDSEQAFYEVAAEMPDVDFKAIEARAMAIAEELGLDVS